VSTPVSPDQPGRRVLPPPDPSFRGRIEVALEDSTGEFPAPLEAPQGAPNVLLVMGDDIGYGHMSGFGGPADTPVFDRLATQGLASPTSIPRRCARRRGRRC
jgi:Sulfatase